ncbi:hypothetical protein C2869_07555 [Saccharobesus litoralis]|uniref:Lipoprotein n=1 Tax=Saccharobesus litoralis TaxID=2172099 RepID=A0A2S0VQ08_9ALTE|nr:hypothetical protein [Saccharobesus litoralis]AWB66296.1 hypothetical protein C2869_07555 [Saccharobesus litoralis]
MRLLVLALSAALTACSSTPYNPFEDEKIVKSNYCQSHLKTLVENNAFMEVKTMVDRQCNNLVVRGWAKGRISSKFNKRCKASYQYYVQRPALYKVARNFIVAGCYPENPDFYQWPQASAVSKK